MSLEAEESQRTLVVLGWVSGFQKLEFTKMLRRELGCSLTVAKMTTDKVLERERVELIVPELKYELLSRLSGDLGAVVIAQHSHQDEGELVP